MNSFFKNKYPLDFILDIYLISIDHTHTPNQKSFNKFEVIDYGPLIDNLIMIY